LHVIARTGNNGATFDMIVEIFATKAQVNETLFQTADKWLRLGTSAHATSRRKSAVASYADMARSTELKAVLGL